MSSSLCGNFLIVRSFDARCAYYLMALCCFNCYARICQHLNRGIAPVAKISDTITNAGLESHHHTGEDCQFAFPGDDASGEAQQACCARFISLAGSRAVDAQSAIRS
jgi:hypothetical protein